MADHQPVDVDPKEIKRAEEMWASFTIWAKYSTVSIIIVLAALAIGFIDW